MMHDHAVLKTIAGEPSRFCIERNLITTDRVLQRWAVSIGIGLPLEEWDDQPRAKPPPLSDDVAIEVDQCILKSPPRTKDLVTRWYKTPQPAEVISRHLKMSARNVYRMHSVCLEFMRWKFLGTGNSELKRLIERVDILDNVGT